MSDTPRTDVAQHNMGSVLEPHYVVDVEVARYLERELAAAIASFSEERERAQREGARVIKLQGELAEAKAQRDKAIAFLHVYRNDTPLGNQPHMLAHDVDQFLKECGK